MAIKKALKFAHVFKPHPQMTRKPGCMCVAFQMYSNMYIAMCYVLLRLGPGDEIVGPGDEIV